MNPEDNNPLTNTGPSAPGMDMTNSSAGAGGYVSPDMGASFAVQGATGPDLGSLGEVVNNGFESTDTTLDPVSTEAPSPIDEPLVPAAPVPGSIGSAISAPPATPAPAAPVAAPSFGASTDSANTPAMGAGPMPAPAVAPQGVTDANAANVPPSPVATSTPGFTPFGSAGKAGQAPAQAPGATSATPSATAPGMTAPVPAGTTAAPGINPAFQPAAKKKSQFSFELGNKRTSIILLILAALFMVSTVVMAVLYFQAAGQKKQIVYTPSPEQEKVVTKETLSCSGEENYGYLVDSEAPIMGQKSLTASYINGTLAGLTAGFSIPFADEGLAIAGKDKLAAEQAALMASVGGSFLANYWTAGNTAEAIVTTKAGFESKDAVMFLYGLTDSETSTDIGTLQDKYEAEGMVCEIK